MRVPEAPHPERINPASEHLRGLARRIRQRDGLAEDLALGVDWSYTQPAGLPRPTQ
jgi:hypothetical protein